MEELLVNTTSFQSSAFETSQFLNLQDPILFEDFDVDNIILPTDTNTLEFNGALLMSEPPRPLSPSQALEESSEGADGSPHGTPGVAVTADWPAEASDPNFTRLLEEYTSLGSPVLQQPLSPQSAQSISASGSSSSEETAEKPGKRSRSKKDPSKQRSGTR